MGSILPGSRKLDPNVAASRVYSQLPRNWSAIARRRRVPAAKLLADEDGDLAAADDVPDRGHAIQHRRIPPRTPKRNGEVERYQQTVAREWAYGQRYRNSNARAQACRSGSIDTTTAGNHSSLSNRSPMGRLVRTTRDTTARRSFGGKFVLRRPGQPGRSGASEPLPPRRRPGSEPVAAAIPALHPE